MSMDDTDDTTRPDDTSERVQEGRAPHASDGEHPAPDAPSNAGPGADADDRRRAASQQIREDAAEAEPADTDDGDLMAEAEEFFVKRDENDNILPVQTTAPGFGTVTVRPMVYGQAERYFGDAGTVADASASTVADILRNHVVDPDLEAHAKAKFGKTEHGQTHYLTAKVVSEEMTPFGPQALLRAVLEESGLNVNVSVSDDGSASIEFEGN